MLSDSERSLLLEELARRPRGLAESFTHEATLTTPACGDTVTVRVTVGPASEIQEFSWHGHGCTVSMAAAAALANSLPAMVPETPAAVAAYTESVNGSAALPGDLEAFAGIGRFPLRAQCATLAWRTLALALVDASGVDVEPAP